MYMQILYDNRKFEVQEGTSIQEVLKNEIERDNFNNLLYKKLYFLKPTEKCELVTFFCDLGIGDEESEICGKQTSGTVTVYFHKQIPDADVRCCSERILQAI